MRTDGAHPSEHLRDVDAFERMPRDEIEAHAKALRALNAITHALLDAADTDDVLARALDAVARFTHFPAVACFRVDEPRGRLELLAARGFAPETLRAAATLPLQGSLSGLAVKGRSLLTSDDVGRDPRTEPNARARLADEGFTGIASMPLIAHDRVIGVLNLIYKGAMGLSAVERELITSIGEGIALGLERAEHVRRIEAESAERQRQVEWRGLFMDASLALASSLDYETMLADVARLVVKRFADACVVDLVEPDGSIRRLAGAHADGERQARVDALVRGARIDPEDDGGVARVIHASRAVLYGEVPDGARATTRAIDFASHDPEHLRVLRELGGRALLCVPMCARGRTLGALSFAFGDPARVEPQVIERAEMLADRCALAIDTARLYREARHAVDVRDKFLLVASHELRTPITPLLLSLQGLERQHASDPGLASSLAKARLQAKRLASLVESLLDVSQLAGARLVLVRDPVDLATIATAVVAGLEEEARRAGCRIDRRLASVQGRWDAKKLERAIRSLLANAIKYGAGKPIELRVERRGETAILSVRDRGIGIAPHDEERIFERFERAVPTTHYGGFGLGLYVALAIVEAHGGTIQVASAPGEGATFTVALPIGREP